MIPLYIFDLDGTLADISHRLHFIRRPKGEHPDWDGFFAACAEDKPLWPAISTLHALLKSGSDVRIWTGRSAVVMNETVAWLQRVIGDEFDPDELELCMRLDGDRRPDWALKKGWLESLPEFDRRRLVAVFEDRDSVVRMWRESGVTCYQVAPGDF